MNAKGAVRWNLKAIMDRCQIGTVQLAEFLNVVPGTVSAWRKAEFLPEINEKRYIQIYNAINELCDINGTPNRKIKPGDLVEFCVDEVRDFGLLDYQYASGNVSKKKKSSQGKNDDTNSKSSIAA